MVDFTFLQNPLSKKWVILAPRRAKRPDIAKGFEPVCPFCPGKEGEEEEVYRIPDQRLASSELASSSGADNYTLPARNASNIADAGGDANLLDANWLVRVLKNKFPFAPIHEVIVHSPDHAKSFDFLPLAQVELILKTYRQRFQTHQDKGNVYIFHNHGKGGGESLPHPHTQLTVVPFEVGMDVPRLDRQTTQNNAENEVSVIANQAQLGEAISSGDLRSQASLGVPETDDNREEDLVQTECFSIFCPPTSQWPDETWIAPKKRGRLFGEITDEEIVDLAVILQKLIKILDLRHGGEFPFNFYIYPGGDWYLRIIPRVKSLGGFEIGTGIFINTQDPKETIAFIQEHFYTSDEEKIRREHMAEYSRHV